ncbi:MAG: archaetidylserine decarboxylase [Proteobacteria bacterium]|nr:archaetidylserine decarboxylase [Pseudomonadota bacterium]
MSKPFAALQRLLPQHQMSRAIGALARSETSWISKAFIAGFARAYKVSLSEAEVSDLHSFASFNDFFTRALKPGARPIDPERGLVAPADGAISQAGDIESNTLLQAKGNRYRLSSLAGALADGFDGGTFATIYLAPHDYHRVHLPLDGTLTDTLAIPGELFSVNSATEASINDLFCRNERLVCRFSTNAGDMLVILVGALIVASIQTVWPGPVSPYQEQTHTRHDLRFNKGDEIGRFLLGSTVIVCMQAGQVTLNPDLQPGTPVRMGRSIASLPSPL